MSAGSCSSSSVTCTWPGRWWVSAASAPALDHPVPGPRRSGPAVPAGQGGAIPSSGSRAERVRNQGQRVVAGQRLMQASSDILLGWRGVTSIDGAAGLLRAPAEGLEGIAVVATWTPPAMAVFATSVWRPLARAHARSGDRVAIASYLGTGRLSTRRWPVRRGVRRPEPARLRGAARGRQERPRDR